MASGGRGAKLVYERVPAHRVALQPTRHDGLVLADCLDIKDGPFRAYLAHELTKRADHRCASGLEEFRSHKRAVTREGQVRSGERHEKDDRHRVDDPRRWVLGWANERKIAALRDELAAMQADLAAVTTELTGLYTQRDSLQDRLQALARIEEYRSWADLDVDEAQARAAAHDAERQRLLAGSSRLDEIARAIADNDAQAAAVGS